ncbi:MAG: YebC/PmpR family DNA-binding transcriptional regulator [Kiritimatiellae bacterium]|nr:YebC/PmpR family DNA-binding transcriptional regulator [Kiritimatiellia bacterium]
MSGHSKWKTIQHKKGAADAKRGKIFSTLSKELTLVARQGGGDADTNAALRAAVQKARAANMPADNIERAIKKGTGELDGVTLEEVVFEGYAAGGVGIVVKALTDNRNRAVAEIRHIFTKYNGSMAAQGAVSRSFRRKGQIVVDCAAAEEEKLMEIILEAGAEDMNQENEQFEIITDPAVFSDVVDALERAGIKPASAEITLLPEIYVPVADKTTAASILKFVDALEDNDDVQDVYTNLDVDDSVLQELSAAES